MILVAVILLPLLVIAIWLFVGTSPQGQQGETVRRFNITTLAVVAASCAAVSLYVWQAVGHSVDRAWCS